MQMFSKFSKLRIPVIIQLVSCNPRAGAVGARYSYNVKFLINPWHFLLWAVLTLDLIFWLFSHSSLRVCDYSLQTIPGGVVDIKPVIGLASPHGVSTVHRAPAWEGRSIAGPKLRLKEFVAFLSQQQQESDKAKVCIEQNQRVIEISVNVHSVCLWFWHIHEKFPSDDSHFIFAIQNK